jgi:hypothetical protein
MDSYDEVHDVKNGRNISTPELDVSSAIKFVQNENGDDDDDKEEFESNARNVSEEVNWWSHVRRGGC